MISKTAVIESMVHECNVTKHLYSKFSPAGFEYRPAADMRSVLELLRHLSCCAIASTKSMAIDNWDLMKAYREEASTMPIDKFPERMDRQAGELKSVILNLSDEELASRIVKFPWGGEEVLGTAIINGPLKYLTAYRMQLFLYAKISGIKGLNTFNCWRGVDGQMPAS